MARHVTMADVGFLSPCPYGMELALVQEASDFYSGQVVLIAGGSLIRQGKDVVATCRRFMEQVQGCGPALSPHSPASTSCWATPMISM